MNALQLGAAEDQDVIKGAIDQLEKFIGNSGEAGAVSQFGGQPLPPESPLVQYVNAVGTDLVPQIRSSRRDFGYRFGVLDSPIINAFALPNGSIYVTTGLLSKMNSHDELANLLGHELVHVTEHHGVNQIGVNVASELALSTLFTKALAGKLDAEDAELGSQISQQLLSSGYSRANESESDEIGQSLAHRSGYNAQGMSDLMKVPALLKSCLEVTHGLENESRTQSKERESWPSLL
jgi:predicted Zn-dependent protease